MRTAEWLTLLLETDPRDAGCAGTFDLLHRYAEALLAGGDPETAMPGVAVHLATCGPCAEDYLGLLALLHDEAQAAPVG